MDMGFEEFQGLPIDEIATVILNAAAETMQEAKQHIVRNGPEDLDMRVIYVPVGSGRQLAMIEPVVVFEDQPPEPAEVIRWTLNAARQNMGAPEIVMILNEGYMTTVPEIPEDYRRGDFRNDPRSLECLVITMMHRRDDGTLRTLHRTIPFIYAQGGIVFQEELGHTVDSLVDGEDLGGMVNDAIREAFMREAN